MTFEVYQDASQEWRWRLKAANGKIVADSGEGYVNRSDALHGIGLLHDAFHAEIHTVKSEG